MSIEIRPLTECEIGESGEWLEVISLPMEGGNSAQRIKGKKTTEVIVQATLGLTINHAIKIETDEPNASGIYRIIRIRKHNHDDDMVVAVIERITR